MNQHAFDQSPTTKLPLFGRVKITRGHWHPGQMGHGPQRWPWWRLFALRVNRLSLCPPTTGFVFWLYFRSGATTLDVVFDRRRLIQPDLYS